MATARRLIFLGISQGIHCWSDYTIIFIITKLWRRWRQRQRRKFFWPLPIFTISKDENLTFSLSPSLLRPLAKNLQKQKLLLGSIWRKSKQKIYKRLLNRLQWSGNNFLPKFVNNGERRWFFGHSWGFAEMLWVNLFS